MLVESESHSNEHLAELDVVLMSIANCFARIMFTSPLNNISYFMR